MPDVAALSVVVSADTSAAEKGLSDLGTKVSGVGSAITGALGGAAIAAVAGLGAAFVGSVKTAADFEKGLSAISAVSGATAEQLEGIRATALQLGKDTSFSASEAAAGMEEMVKAGVSLQDVMGGAGKAALDLAAAGGLSVAESATIASNAMNTFGKSGSDMAHIADVIAGAANASAIDVHDFGFSLSSVGAVAATIGVNFEDTAAAIAVLGQAGLKGSDAGTSLKTMLLNLSPSSKAATAAFRELGIITADGSNKFFDAEGKAKSLAEISGILQDSLKGLTKEQQINALQTMFGTDAVRAAAIMAKAGAEGFDEMAAAMSKVTATAVAEERLNNLVGSLDKLGGSLETAGIMVGSLFTPALKTMADMLTTQVNAGIAVLEQIPDIIETIKQVMAGDWSPAETIQPVTLAVGELAVAFRDTLWPAIQVVVGFVTGSLVPALQSVGGFLAAHPGLVAALAAAWATFSILSTVAGWVMGLVSAFGAASAAITAAGGVIGAIVALLGGPLTVAILAVSAAVALLVVAWTENWGGIQEKTAAVWAYLEPIFTAIVDWLGAKIPPVLEWISNTGWPALVSAGQAVAAFVTGTLVPAITDLIEWIGPKLSAVVTWMSETGWPALVTAGETVWAVVQEIIRFFQELYVELDKREVFATLKTLWDDLVIAGQAVWDAIKKLDELFRPFQELVSTFNAGAGKVLVETFGTMGTSGAEAAKGVDVVKAAVQGMATVIELALFPLKNFLKALDDIGKMVEAAKSWKLPSWMGGSGSAASGSSGNADWDKIAREEGVDPGLLASLIQQESGGNQSARSGAGAIGLTQLMPGTAAGMGLDPNDPAQNVRGGARYLKQMLDQFGDEERALIAYNAGPGGGAPAESIAYARRVLAGRVKLPAGVGAAQQNMTPQINQFGLKGGSLTAAEAAAFCGPAAAMWFANIYGRMPDKAEAEAMARSIGWTPEWGMTGPGSEQRLLSMMGVSSNVDYTPTPDEIGALAAQNVPFMLSAGGTTGHYYQVQGGSLGGLNVGGSGVAAGGSAVMSLDQITQLSGAINGIITLAPQMGAALTTASAEGGAALSGLLLSATTLSDGSTVAITQMGQQITASIVDASGQVIATYGAMAETVVTQTATMAAGSLTSVTNLGTGIMTTITDSAGSTITTITDMSGQVTSQYATLANGVSLTMGDMAAGVLTSTTDLGTGVMTTVQDMSGNYITTITDLAGNVTSQYVSLGADVTAATGQMAADVTAETVTMAESVTTETAAMSETVLTSVTDMGDGLITITTDAAGTMTAVITDMSGEVTSTYSSMSSDVVSTAEDMGQGVVSAMEDAGGDIQGVVEDWGSSIGDELGSIADDAQEQAADIGQGITDGIAEGIDDGSGDVMDAVRDVVKDAIDEAKDEAESDSPSKLFARELGLPIAQGVAAGIEHGSGLVADATRGLVGVPEYTAPLAGTGSGGGGTETIILKIDIGGQVAEEIVVTGRELAVRHGRIPTGALG